METCTRRPACSAIARVTAGWACPRTATAIPPRKSRYDLPRSSYNQLPSPRTKVTGKRV